MFNLLRHPALTFPLRFLARIAMSALWGIILSPFELEVKVGFGAVLAVVAGVLSLSFFSGIEKLGIADVGLCGLAVAGEAMAVGTFVFAALGAFSGHVNALAMFVCAFSGTLLPVYAITTLYQKNNTAKPRGSNT